MEMRPLLAVVLAAAAIGVVPASSHATQLAAQSAGQPAASAVGTPLAGYRIQSTSRTGDSGATISQPGYNAGSWVPAGPRSTVLAALLANGQYSDPFFSNNMASIPTSEFTVPWWYRSEFNLTAEPGTRTYLDFSGVISKADVFVNGTQVANATQVAGAYTHH
ncbi:MAG TPA: exo-beta-D-glucosaminidase, partial [Micromonosporaceae bacterium]|nr:exo-beta-D-glucosaminidase [Micromonosporaceae bacterium]HCU51945.1 exo-beta-D-glucosaminidase [Micromonosporaceae bacterium]